MARATREQIAAAMKRLKADAGSIKSKVPREQQALWMAIAGLAEAVETLASEGKPITPKTSLRG